MAVADPVKPHTEKSDRARAAARARRALARLENDDDGSALVGFAEAADFLGVRKPRVARLIEQDRMPAPIASLTCGQVWIREELRPLRDALRSEQ